MLDQITSYAFLLLELACGVVIVVRFRGSPGAVLGGIAFGVWAATNITRRVLGALEVEWWEYNVAFTLADLAANGCLLAALITGRVYNQAQGATGKRDVTYTGVRSPMSIAEVLFSFSGRISRSEYWLKGFLILLPFGILNNILMYGVDTEGARTLAIILAIISLWPGSALLVKRWHDRDRSAWWFLALLLPFLNLLFGIWIIIEVGFLKGTDGANRFGQDPLQRDRETEKGKQDQVAAAARPSEAWFDEAIDKMVSIYREHPQGFVRGSGGAPEEELRRIGEMLNRRGGMDLMRTAHAEFSSRCGVPGAARNVEFVWDGIGSWMG